MSVTLFLIGVCVAVSLLGWVETGLIRAFGLNAHAVLDRGQFYRILSHAFFHADIWHLLINMYVFFNFARHLEPMLGKKHYMILLWIGLLGSSLFSMLMQKPHTIGIGFSGVVSAVVFCMIVLFPKMRLLVFFVPMPAWVFAILYTLYSLYAGQRGGDGIDHWAHLGGAAAGAGYAFFL